MSFSKAISILVCAAMLSSCATPALWDATDPGEFVDVTNSGLSVEDLEREGVGFFVDEKTGRIFVEKTGMKKFGNYSVRVLATPVTVTIDTAIATGVIISVIAMAYGVDSFEEQIERIEWDQYRRKADPGKPMR